MYKTSRATLCRDADSMLAHMFSDDMPPASQDKDGNFIIDRDGDTFKYVLNYLRDGVCVLPLTHHARAELLREADFYQVMNELVVVAVKLVDSALLTRGLIATSFHLTLLYI